MFFSLERSIAWKAYHIIPIDWMWEFLPTVPDIAGQFARMDATTNVAGAEHEPKYLDDFLSSFEKAKELASEVGWEGDYQSEHSEPRVFFLPSEGDFEYGFVWKQSNNGSTFVISPYALPHLDNL